MGSRRERDVAAIRTLAEDWHVGWVKGDADALLALYSDDPVLLPQSQPAIRGRETILGMYREVFIVRRQQDGAWKITHLMSNSDRPAAVG